YRYEKNPRVFKIDLDHSVDRIEALANDAVIVGTQKSDLYFTPIALDQRFNQAPYRSASYIRQNASQGELRSHGFFYKPQGERNGYLGLPVRGRGQPGYSHLTQDSASILFLKHQNLQFQNMGELYSHLNERPNDGCKASCVDWYGNARPLFLKGRVFALLGYEIVEGKIDSDHLYEKQRVDYSRVIRMEENR
ncbi:MAG: hypothetical protein H7A32_06105, partial [Deltaproteobacteria bacterium]|nr:hypothetical protein [Deltaproteobacteria bacterium]